MPIELKRDPYLWAFAAVLVLATFALVWHHDVTWKEGAAFITGALAMPALFGTKKKDDDNRDGGVTVPVDDAPGPSVQQFGPKKLPGIITPITMAVMLITPSCTPADPKLEAESGYDAQQKACIASHATKAAIDKCRDDVKAAWSNDAGVDGGAR